VTVLAETVDLVHDSREVFLACLWAQCSPGAAQGPVPTPQLTPDPALDTAAAVLLALLDPGIGLATVGTPETEAVAARVLAMTGAHDSPVEAADFVLVGDQARPDVVRQARVGSAIAPERGATIVYCADPRRRARVTLTGPGIDGSRSGALAVPRGELDARAARDVVPPAGVDLIVAEAGAVVAVPRSTTVEWADA
jgi:alpha-D-ribose 1-methylphosphonate 5-triphosphate synthase subunit PhnH